MRPLTATATLRRLRPRPPRMYPETSVGTRREWRFTCRISYGLITLAWYLPGPATGERPTRSRPLLEAVTARPMMCRYGPIAYSRASEPNPNSPCVVSMYRLQRAWNAPALMRTAPRPGRRLPTCTVCRRRRAGEKTERPDVRHGSRTWTKRAIVGATSELRA